MVVQKSPFTVTMDEVAVIHGMDDSNMIEAVASKLAGRKGTP